MSIDKDVDEVTLITRNNSVADAVVADPADLENPEFDDSVEGEDENGKSVESSFGSELDGGA